MVVLVSIEALVSWSTTLSLKLLPYNAQGDETMR